MTADNAPSPAVVSASNYTAPYNPWKAFKQTGASDPWFYSGNDAPQWIKLDLGEGNATAANRYTLTCPNNNYDYPGMPLTWVLEGSNNDSTWATLDTREEFTGTPWQNIGSATMMWSFFFNNSTAYRYYRWTFNSKETGAYGWKIDEIELIYDTVLLGYTADAKAISPVMVGEGDPAPYVVTASNHTDPNEPWKIFNGDNRVGWAYASTAGGPWVKIDLGSGGEAFVYKYKLVPTPSNSKWPGMPWTWELQGSNNDSDWDTLHEGDSTSTEWMDNEAQTFVVTNPGTYRYYRLYLNMIEYGGTNWWICEWELAGPPVSGFWPVILRMVDQQRRKA